MFAELDMSGKIHYSYITVRCFKDLRDEAGYLGRPIPGGGYFVPRYIQLETLLLPQNERGEVDPETMPRAVPTPALTWGGRRALRVKPSDETVGALDGFIRLHAQPDEAILAFAREWGVLGLCKDRLPFTHSRPRFEQPTASPCLPALQERLSDWREFSAKAVIALRVAQLSVEGRPDWETERDSLEVRWRREIKIAEVVAGRATIGKREEALRLWYRRESQARANKWLKDSGVSLFTQGFETGSGRLSTGLTIGVEYANLFDLIAVQLLLAVSRADRIASCAECGMPFARRLRPSERRIYCPACGAASASVKLAVRRSREAEREARQLFSRGMGITEIAERLKRNAATVERWIKKFKRSLR